MSAVTEIAQLPRSVTAKLKLQTAQRHRDAERSPFQQALVRGTLPRDLYVRWLVQMAHMHTALEVALEGATGFDAMSYSRTPQLRADLGYFSAAQEPPLPAIRAFADALCGGGAFAALGALYVLEGSMNGGRFIARAVRRAYALTTEGCRYLDPYGESQPIQWQEFKQRMDEYVGEADATECYAMADLTFACVTQLGDELLAPRTSS